MRSATSEETVSMNDPILRRAMEKRDEAIREVERWETWIKAYAELSVPDGEADALDIPMARREPVEPTPPEEIDVPTLPHSGAASEVSSGKGSWLRGKNGTA